MSEPTPPSDERKIATVLFADLVGSTALASEEDPERVRALLERFYTAMATEIEAAGGTIEKFAGDAVMAAFGAPAAQEDHAERALHAALAMQHRLGELFGDRLSARIGVNTGDVVVGAPRMGSSFVSGDAVNVAARLEQAAEPGEVLVGKRTASAVRGAFEFGAPTVLPAKGKREGIEARRLLRALSLMRPRGIPGLGSSFVGREAELATLTQSYESAVAEGRPQLVTILGDPGLGKTRLVREFWQQLEGVSPEPLRRTGRCLSYGQGTAYWALAEILRQHLGILESDSTETVLSLLGERRILGLTLGLDVAAGIHPLSARDQLYAAWVGFLEELAADQPLVLLVEDIHWAEEPLLDLLERIVGDARGPLLVLTTARPELVDERPGWGARRAYAETIFLEPLPPETASLMLSDLLAKTLPPELATTLVARAEGNPFFVEELVATLMDRGVIERANGSWRVHDIPAGFEIPDSVRSVLAARIDLLGPAEKEALQAASVIGRIFWTGPLYELPEMSFRIFESWRSAISSVGVPAPHSPASRSTRLSTRSRARSPTTASPAPAGRGCMPPSPPGWIDSARAATSGPRCSPTTTPRPPSRRAQTSLGPERKTSSSNCRRRRFAGSPGPESSPSIATRSTRRWSSSIALWA
jgi:class 3 adenylate cyclase